MALIMLALVASGLYMTELSWDGSAKGTFYWLHKSFGMVIMPLVILRLIYRFASNIPEAPQMIKIVEKVSAKLGVVLLYWFMLVIPMSGYMMSITGGHPVEVFGLIIPNIIEPNKALSAFFYSIHTQIWYFFLAIVGVHIAYSFKHLICDKVNLFSRMW